MKEIIQSPYEILNLPVNATSEVVKKQYKSLIRQYPPEQNPEEFNKIRTAYDHIKSELFSKRDTFPLYKKISDIHSAITDTPSVSQHDKLLMFFETPFNTSFELEKLLDGIVI